MKKLIIEEFFPVKEVSNDAAIEKLVHPGSFNIHHYWSRKPLVTTRAVAIGSLIELDKMPWKVNPEHYDSIERARYVNFLELIKLYGRKLAHNYNPDRKSILKAIKETWGEVPWVLDAFAGAGSIPFEVLRLGVNVVANDYSPLAYLILKATLEYPKKYGWKLYRDVEKYAKQIVKELKEELGHLYPKHDGKNVLVYVYAWVVKCPHCGFKTPLVGNWQLADEKKGGQGNLLSEPYYLGYVIEGDSIRFEVRKGKVEGRGNAYRGIFRCIKCGNKIHRDDVSKYIREHEEEIMIVTFLSDGKKKMFDIPSDEDIKAFELAKKELKQQWDYFCKEGLIPYEELPKKSLGIYAYRYLPKYYQLFNPRQLLLILKYADKVKKIIKEIAEKDEEYAKAVGVYLSFILAKCLNYNCRCCVLDTKHLNIIYMTSFFGASMRWDHSEVNPFVKFNGSIVNMTKNVLDGLKYIIDKIGDVSSRVEIYNKSILDLNFDRKFKAIITDPPYYDYVPYGEVGEILYVWHNRVLGWLFEKESDAFKSSRIDSSKEISVNTNRDERHFEKLFIEAMRKMYDFLDDDGVLVLFYAHKDFKAWSFVLDALRKSGFVVTATYPICTEMEVRVVARGKKSIHSSLVIVARKRINVSRYMDIDKEVFIEDIVDEIKSKVIENVERFKRYGIKGCDLFIVSMGAVLEVLTKYSELKSRTGRMTIERVVEMIVRNLDFDDVEDEKGQVTLDRFLK